MEEMLKVKIVGDDSSLQKTLNNVKKQVNQTSKNTQDATKGSMNKMQQMVSGITKNITNMFGGKIPQSIQAVSPAIEKAFGSSALQTLGGFALGITAIVMEFKKVKQIADETAKIGDDIDKMSQKVNMNAQQFQEWGYIMELGGGSAENLRGVITPMIRQMNEGNQAFEKLGVSIRNADGSLRDSNEVFNDTIVALSKMPNATERNAIALEVFGRQAGNLAPILNNGAEAIKNAQMTSEVLGLQMSSDAVKVSAQYTDMMQTLKKATQSVKSTIGSAFLPVLTNITKAIVKAIAYIKIFASSIFGVKGEANNLGVDKSFNNGASGANNYSKAVDKSTKKVKELNKQLMGFDELNTISSTKSSDNGIDMADMSLDVDTSSINSLFSDKELGTLQKNLNKFKKTMDKIGGAIKDWSIILEMLVGVVLVVVGCCTGNFLLIAGGLALVGLSVATGLSSNSEGQNGFEHLWESTKDLFSRMGNWFETHFKNFVDWLGDIKDKIGDKLLNIRTKISDEWQSIRDWFNDKVQPKFTLAYWKEKFDNIKEAIKSKLADTKTAISDKWKSIVDWFNDRIKPKFTKDYWKSRFDGIRAGMADRVYYAKKAITDTWAQVTEWFNDRVKPKFTTSYWKSRFDGIRSGMKSCLNGVISAVENAVNYIIRKINTLSWRVPSWVPSLGGKTWGFNFKEVSIPRLETGGIATSSILANIGENGKEAVLPLERNTGWMDILAERINQGNSKPIEIILNIGGSKFGKACIKSINQAQKQNGAIMLNI